MVFDHQHEHGSQWAAIELVAAKIDCSGEALRNRVRRSERDRGQRAGPTTDEREPKGAGSFESLRVRAGIEPSVGSVGDCHDNALAETINGLFKAEAPHRHGPWRSFEAVEFATLERVGGFDTRRLLEPIGNVPPAEAETRYHAQAKAQALAA